MSNIAARRTLGKHRVPDSEAFLVAVAPSLARYSTVGHFAYAADSTEALQNHDAIDRHFTALRTAVARELWSREFFIGASVLDDLIFTALVHEKSTSPVRQVIEYIRDGGLHKSGLVVYPLHSFGLADVSFPGVKESAKHFVAPTYGFAITPQTNSYERTCAFLERARVELGVGKPISRELLDHWRRSRPTKWLETNPLLVVRVSNLPGSYYENQFLLLTKLRATAAFCCMMAALQEHPEGRRGYLFSSSRVNNMQTLDIYHYIVWHPSRSKVLDGDCVPMNANPIALAELCELGVDLSPAYWARRRRGVDRIWNAVSCIQSGFLSRALSERQSPHARVYGKLFLSMQHFQRSFRRFRDQDDACVSLSTAFEVLLVDSFVQGIRGHLADCGKVLLRGLKGRQKLLDAIESVYVARNELVHGGRIETKPDIENAQRAYVWCFTRLTERLDRFDPRSQTPIGSMLRATER